MKIQSSNYERSVPTYFLTYPLIISAMHHRPEITLEKIKDLNFENYEYLRSFEIKSKK